MKGWLFHYGKRSSTASAFFPEHGISDYSEHVTSYIALALYFARCMDLHNVLEAHAINV